MLGEIIYVLLSLLKNMIFNKKNSNCLTLNKFCVDRHDRILRSTGSAVGGSSDCLET